MPTCELAATGMETGLLLPAAAIALLGIGVGTAAVLTRKGKRRAALLGVVPVIVAGLVVTGTPAPSFANAGSGCVAEAPAGGGVPVVPPVTPPATEFTAGAVGIGDPYFPLDGNGGYDVGDYDLDLAYDPTTGSITGTATITATATQNLSAFNLDLDGLAVSSVAVDGAPATWTSASTPISIVTGQPLVPGSGDGEATPPRTEVTVTPPAGIPSGLPFTTVVEYGGVPTTIDDAYGISGVFHQADGGALIVGQPRVAATWFPASDHPADKATLTVTMSAPSEFTVVGNGHLVSQTPVGANTEWTWRSDQPMAPYLATASIGDYELTSFSQDGIDYWNAIDEDLYDIPADDDDPTGPSAGEAAASIFADEPEVIDFLSSVFGPYPFTEAGGIAADQPDLQFALENQTRPIYGAWAFSSLDDPSVVVHELAHQWYGDSLAMHRWSDIWLNEGFATYAEWLWAEHDGGDTPAVQAQAIYDGIQADDEFWTVEVADPGSANIFADATYDRGAMTLQALRNAVGDDAFFAIIQGWAAENAGGNVSTDQFIAYAEQVSGQDLTALFDTWIYSTGKPPVAP
ncbi:M1 family metallopeptidase [Herbiconiux sp. CPCC 205763]|uniref:Aminopeptidase N n=1 Tax=Herbiconiux aconitum TaxID=2970913 RepID=A0ABT2GKA2_9MICO|nr:M1 family metallopeptidase [Herbiconiux aconitum]MCS5716645.1 M1 family metallopeptidase [Herbiconiux aconitum]